MHVNGDDHIDIKRRWNTHKDAYLTGVEETLSNEGTKCSQNYLFPSKSKLHKGQVDDVHPVYDQVKLVV